MVRTRRGGCPHPPSRAELGFRSAGVSPAIRARTAGGGCPYVASARRHFMLVQFEIALAPLRPAQRQLHRRAHPARLSRVFRTFIKRHDDVRAKSDLGFGRGFRAEEGVTFRSHLDGSTQFLSPEAATEAQIGLGADIIMAFDECTEYPAEPSRVRSSMELTLRWAERSKKYFEEHKHEVPWGRGHVGTAAPSCPGAHRRRDASTTETELRSAGRARRPAPTCSDHIQTLFGIVQGGMDFGLRKESAERTIEIGFPGYAIGGLSVGEPRKLTREIVEATIQHLPAETPRYLMGVGTPEEIVEYANLGIDMMDCVLPTRAARHGLLVTSEGKISIKQARYAGDRGQLDPNCGCRVCARYSRAYLRHLYASNEILAQVLNTVHNLSFYLDTMRAVRHSIALGDRPQFLSGK